LILFACRGYIIDEKGAFTLRSEPDAGYGRRITDTLDKDYMTGIVGDGAEYIAYLQKNSGKYIYGYYPTFDNVIQSYNILRHAGATWSLINAYRITGDESLKEPIQKAVKYLMKKVRYKDDDTAYVIEEDDNEIKLGANGISLLCILDYMTVFGSNEYDGDAVKIANGILALQNQGSGGYTHVLYYGEPGIEDYAVKSEFRTVFYDGEATLSLCKMYGRFGDPRWLDAAKKAMDYFIANDYTKYRDHWLSYAVNELTKYAPEEKYYEMGLKNVKVNIGKIRDKQITSHIDLELMLAVFPMYDRIKTNGIRVAFMDEFDEKDYLDTILKRTDYNMNAFAYPELAMYFRAPKHILNGFVIRSDGFRSRIDDTQHHIGGYCLYIEYYDKIYGYYSSL